MYINHKLNKLQMVSSTQNLLLSGEILEKLKIPWVSLSSSLSWTGSFMVCKALFSRMTAEAMEDKVAMPKFTALCFRVGLSWAGWAAG